MAGDLGPIIGAAQAGLDAQAEEVLAARRRQMLTVMPRVASGGGDIAEGFALQRRFRLVFVRVHFVGGSGAAPLVISLDSAQGAAHDVELFRIVEAGMGQDVHLRITADESAEPSAWSFAAGDALRLDWSNPDPGAMSWGIEVGLALAS